MFARSVLRAAAMPVLASLAAAAAVSAAPVSFGDSSYDVVFDDEMTWTEARDAASTAGGQLAVISSQEEQSFIESLLVDRDAATGSYWIGIQDFTGGRVFETLDRQPLEFTNWAPTEPNDAGGVGESVGGIYWTSDADAETAPAQFARRGGWNDLPEEGYPNDEIPATETDLFRAGYLVEFANGDGDGGGTGGGGGGGGDGGGATPIPLPPAAWSGLALMGVGLFNRWRKSRA